MVYLVHIVFCLRNNLTLPRFFFLLKDTDARGVVGGVLT